MLLLTFVPILMDDMVARAEGMMAAAVAVTRVRSDKKNTAPATAARDPDRRRTSRNTELLPPVS